MRRRSPSIALLLVVFLVAAPTALSLGAGAAAPIHVLVLLDLGDGNYYWSNVSIDDPAAENASWGATLEAGLRHGLTINSSWFSCCGVAVTDIGGRLSPTWPALLLWNRSAGAWGDAPSGISALILGDGDAIAWYVAGFDPTSYELRRPVPTPDHPLPVIAFRGDLQNTGSSPSKAPTSRLVAWDHDTGTREIGSTPAVAYGMLFVTTFKGLLALDAKTGAELWRNPDVRGFSTPAVFDRTLVAAGSNGTLYRLNASDGRALWNTSLVASPGFSGITSAPKVLYDKVFVGTFNESGGDGEVVALWLANGTPAWRHPTASVHYSSPAIQDGTLFVGVMGLYNTSTQITFDPPYGLLALDAHNGSQHWFYATQGPVSASPLVAGSTVVVPSKDGALHAVGTDGTPLWTKTVGADVASVAFGQGLLFVGGGAFGRAGSLVALDLQGTVRWSYNPNGPVQASPAYADGKVFFSTNTANGTIYALNASTGERVWSFIPEPLEYIRGSPVVADGVLYAPSDNGHVYAFAGGLGGLATLTLPPTGAVSPGKEAAVTLLVGSIEGRVTGARVELTLPAGVTFINATPTPVEQSGPRVVWQLGNISYGSFMGLGVWFRLSESVPPGTNLTLNASLSGADDQGAPMPAHHATGTLVAGAAPPPSLLPAFGPTAAIAASVGAAWIWRRRRPPVVA